MKLMILLLSFSVVFLSSCESEYQHQMKKARELARQEVRVHQSMKNEFTARSVQALSQLKREIGFHAHLSGNKSLFFQELEAFKSGLAKEKVSDVLLSKYP